MRSQLQKIMKMDRKSSFHLTDHEDKNDDHNHDNTLTPSSSPSSSSLLIDDHDGDHCDDDELDVSFLSMEKNNNRMKKNTSKRREKSYCGSQKIVDSTLEMTPYNDAAYLSSLWPCQRPSSSSTSLLTDDDEDLGERKQKGDIPLYLDCHQCTPLCNRRFLHDGKDWYAWDDTERRWLVANQMMHRLVAESCTEPYRRRKSICESNIIHCLKETNRSPSSQIIYKENLERSRQIQKHLERLHGLEYQNKVLTIAAKLFFSLPRGWQWGPSSDILPLLGGEVLVRDQSNDDDVQKRRVEPSDCLHAEVPTLPSTSAKVPIPTQWMQMFSPKDLRSLADIIGQALLPKGSILLSPSMKSINVVIWGIEPSAAIEFMNFMKMILGENYCCVLPGSPTPYVRVMIESIFQKSEQDFLSSKFKQTLITSLITPSSSSSNSSSSSSFASSFNLKSEEILRIVLVGRVKGCISPIPSELKHLYRFFIIPGTQIFDKMTRFWGSSSSLFETQTPLPDLSIITTQSNISESEPWLWFFLKN